MVGLIATEVFELVIDVFGTGKLHFRGEIQELARRYWHRQEV